MKNIWIIFILHFSYTFGNDEKAHLCCKNENNTMTINFCIINGKKQKIDLKCDTDEKAILNKFLHDEDFYNVTQNGSLYVHEFEAALDFEDYCLTNIYDEELEEEHEVAVVCLKFIEESMPFTYTLRAILIFISVVFILLTMYIYYLLPELRETQDKVTIFTLFNLVTFLFFLGILQTETPHNFRNELCVALAFLVFFFSIAYFAWLNCVIANVWKVIVLRKWKVTERTWYLMSHIYGWSIPVIATFTIGFRHSIKPLFGINTCWFHDEHEQMYYMYLPISVMLVINVILSIWSGVYLTSSDFSPDTRKALCHKSILYLKLFLLGGVTWILEVLSFVLKEYEGLQQFWLIGDVFNCLHGVLIFIILIIWRQKIRKELAGKRVLCFRCPAKWAEIDDNEDEICLEDEGDKSKYDLMIKSLK